MSDTNNNTFAVIMAGGVGSRFWPASRRARPKQLLALGPTDDSLIRATVSRILPLVPAENVLIVTSAALADATAAELPELPRENILGEPCGRNTAPCVGWAASHALRRTPDATLMVLPADHHIGDPKTYLQTLSTALAATQDGGLVTVGLRPTRPETGYGYIEPGDELAAVPGVFEAARFVEKPNRERAEQFVANGLLWNSGMFFFRADAVLRQFERQLPATYSTLRTYDEAAAAGREAEAVAATYGDIESISFDHGIMEGADIVRVVPASFGWSDLGSWTTAHELAGKDEEGNAVPSESVLVDASGNFVSAPEGKLVALVGVEDLVVVDTGDALLVMPRERAQDVKRVVETLAKRDDARR